MITEKSILVEITNWKNDYLSSATEKAFKMGDLIAKYVIYTKLIEAEVIRRIMDDFSELTMQTNYYYRAAKLSRVYTKRQRQVLIDKFVLLDKCDMLAGARYDGDYKRVNIISEIKTGKIKVPWTAIHAEDEKPTKKKNNRTHDNLPERANPDVWELSTIYKHGKIDEEKLGIWLSSIVHRLISKGVRPEYIERSIRQAVSRSAKLSDKGNRLTFIRASVSRELKVAQ